MLSNLAKLRKPFPDVFEINCFSIIAQNAPYVFFINSRFYTKLLHLSL